MFFSTENPKEGGEGTWRRFIDKLKEKVTKTNYFTEDGGRGASEERERAKLGEWGVLCNPEKKKERKRKKH